MMSFLKKRPRWVYPFVAILIGALGALGQEPFGFAPLIIVMMVLGFRELSQAKFAKRAAGNGWLIGFGYFLVTLHWIVSPFQVDAEQHAWMAPFALLFLAAGMALFWGLAFGLAQYVGGSWPLVFTWPLAEMLRGYIFTGFPWGSPSQAMVNVISGQSLAWFGPHGLMFFLSLSAYLLVWVRRQNMVLRFGYSIVVLACLIVPTPKFETKLTEHTVRLVQPNAAQRDKWNPEKSKVFVNRLLDFTSRGNVPDLIIWPETAVPFLAHNATGLLQAAGEAGRGAPVALGILRAEGATLYNSMIVLNASGQITQTYDKHHLVPFGEYIPLRPVLSAFGLRAMADMFGDGFGRGDGAKLVDFGPLGKALPLICYEAVFAHDVGAAAERPSFLMQITNDAWFGNFAGPKQHLAQAQMRAIEQGLPLMRAANTGISAMISPRGLILDSLALNQAGYLDALLPAPLKATVYSKTGDLPILAFLITVLSMVQFGIIRNRKIRDD